MSQPAAPVLTVRYDGSQRTFAAGHDVVVGRDLRADVRIAHPLISRAHLPASFDHGRWLAIDNGSLNGMFVHGRRIPAVDISNGLDLNIGNPDGPRLSFELGAQQEGPGRSAAADVVDAGRDTSVDRHHTGAGIDTCGTGIAPPSPSRHLGRQHRHRRQPGQGPSTVENWPTQARPSPPIPRRTARPRPPSKSRRHRRHRHPPRCPRRCARLRPAAGGIDEHRDIHAADPAARRSARSPGRRYQDRPRHRQRHRDTRRSRLPASRLADRHTRRHGNRDNRSINGTFVNGTRVETAMLEDGDVVTIGNVDLSFNDGTLVRRTDTEAATATGGLEVRGVSWTIEHNRTLLDNITLAARPGTLTAVIGPSGAGKSTLARLIAGYTHPTNGTVTFEGHNIHAEYASLRSRIGMVPQDDVVHGQLTVNQALMYAAELRPPPDTTKEDRQEVVAQALEELEMTQHAETRVDKLSGGQRKRASVALELLTGPSLLILDEPTSGLDPALDRQVMTMLRQLADAGRVVLVVTHSLTYLDVCDQVLLLAPGGKTAFLGPPSQIGPAMGTTNWADIFSAVAGDPQAANDRYQALVGPTPPPPDRDTLRHRRADSHQPAPPVLDHLSPTGQADRLGSRVLRVPGDAAFIMGVLSLSVPGTVGFESRIRGDAPNEPGQILVLLNVGAIFMGTTLTIRDLIGERAIFRREQAVGLSTTAHLLAKVCVYSVFAIAQSSIATGITILGKGTPTQGAVSFGSPTLELFIGMSATTVASAMVGLLLSAIAKSNEQIMPLLVAAVMSQLVFSGGMIPVTDRLVLDQMSWLTPARWGFASSASTIDLIKLVPGPLTPKDRHWDHTASTWWFNIGMLGLISVSYLTAVRWKIRLGSHTSKH